MFKERIGNPQEELNQLMEDMKEVVEQWSQLNDARQTDKGRYEGDVRNLEQEKIAQLIMFLKNNPGLIEQNKQDLQFVGEEYLGIGDCMDLQKEFASLVGLKYYDPFSMEKPEKGAIGPHNAARQILKEIGEKPNDDDNKKMN
ncbi:hypothetical protein HGA64_04190 [Candidatus Falkowbacteria bacterium]|nr:hypothetical protein [Candidatus Falkowbacteria bacterium]